MKKVLFTAVALSLFAAVVGAQTSTDPASPSTGAFTLSVSPAVSFPLAYWYAGLHPGFYKLTLGAAVDAEYRFGFLPMLFLKAGVSYRRAPLSAGPVLHLLEASAGVGAQFVLAPSITLKPYAAGGYHYGILSMGTGDETGGAWMARAGVNVQLDFFAPIGIVVGAAFVIDQEAFLGIQASVGASCALGAAAADGHRVEEPAKTKPEKLAPAEAPKVESRPAEAAGGLTLTPAFDLVFPLFYGWYEKNPFGTLTLKNDGREMISGISVSFQMEEFQAHPVTFAVPGRLEPGKELGVPLTAVFMDKILDINSRKPVQSRITVDYQAGNEKKQAVISPSVTLEGRNAMSWIDDRRAAAFVTSQDPPVMILASNVMSALKNAGNTVINPNLTKAMAIHEAIRLYQMVYTKDPNTPYSDQTRQGVVDYLKFPRETLLLKGGDCDDLSILYCALLESLGVETAFITVPGHIYAAVSLQTTPADARRRYKHPEDLIFVGDATWVPVEVTRLDESDDFLAVWQYGAREWREAQARANPAALIPVREAWNEYRYVNLPSTMREPDMWSVPAVLVERYQKTIISFLNREMADRLAELTKLVADSKADPKAVNKLGKFYAEYGRYAEAKTQFTKAAGTSRSYLPPLVNLGQIALLENDLPTALAWFEDARKIDAKNSLVLLGIARVNLLLENYGSARVAMDELKKVDPTLAQEFAYLDQRGEEGKRAAEQTKEVAKWAD